MSETRRLAAAPPETPSIKKRELAVRCLDPKPLELQPKQFPEDKLAPLSEVQKAHQEDVSRTLEKITKLDWFDQELNDKALSPYYQEYLQERLFQAVMESNQSFSLLTFMNSLKISPNSRDELSKVAAQVDLYLGKIKILLNRINPAYPYPVNKKRPIEIAADQQNWQCVLAFTEVATDDVDDAHYSVALTQAVAAGRLDVVSQLRDKNAKVTLSVNGYAPLYFAVSNQDIPMLEFLLAEGADPRICVGSDLVKGMSNSIKQKNIAMLLQAYPQVYVTKYEELAAQQHKSGQFNLAEASYKKLLVFEPSHLKAHESLIELYRAQGKLRLTVPHYENVIQALLNKKNSATFDLNDSIYLASLCSQFVDILHTEKIESSFKLLELIGIIVELCQQRTDPQGKAIFLALCRSAGDIHFAEGNWQDALAWFLILQKERNLSADLLFACAQCAQKLGRVEEASSYFLQMMRAQSSETESKFHELELSALSTEWSPLDALINDIYIRPANVLLNQGQLLAALDRLEEVAVTYPRHPGIYDIFLRVNREVKFITSHPIIMTGKEFVKFLQLNMYVEEIELGYFDDFIDHLQECINLKKCAREPIFQQAGIFYELKCRLSKLQEREIMMYFFQQIVFLARYVAQLMDLLPPKGVGVDSKKFGALISSHYHLLPICVRMIRFALARLPHDLQEYNNEAVRAVKKAVEELLPVHTGKLNLTDLTDKAVRLKSLLCIGTPPKIKEVVTNDPHVRLLFNWIEVLGRNEPAARMHTVYSSSEKPIRASQSADTFYNAQKKKTSVQAQRASLHVLVRKSYP